MTTCASTPNTALEGRPLIPVAAGCLFNAAGEVLICQRPAGKIAAGKWEFPGGKIEPGETVQAALERELAEELGVVVEAARPLLTITHHYSDRSVRLHAWRVDQYAGEVQGHDGQAWAWVRPERLHDWELLAADAPIVAALRLPVHYVFTPPEPDLPRLQAGLPRLPRGALLRLRLPGLADAVYAAFAERLLPECRALGLQLILDRDPALVSRLGAAGWHAHRHALRELRGRPLPPDYWTVASVHDAEELGLAESAGLDCGVLGALQPTPSHPQAKGMGWEEFQRLVEETRLPVYALGGLGPGDMATAWAHGAQGVAGISAYWR